MSTTIELPVMLASRIVFNESVRFNVAADGRRFTSRFIEPGIISYKNVPGGGIELLRKETIDRALTSALGNPVTIKHVALTAENELTLTNGTVDKVYYNDADGWYYCDGEITSSEAQSLIRRGQKPSCGYAVLAFGPGGTYHGIKYDKEIAEIRFNHLAIVDKPRYEGATFRLNSILSTDSTMFKFFRKIFKAGTDAAGAAVQVPEFKQHVEAKGDTMIEIDGKPVRLNELAEIFEKHNPSDVDVAAEDMIELPGRGQVKMSELVDCYRKNSAAPEPVVAPVVPAVAAVVPVVGDPATRENAAPATPVVVPAVAAVVPVVEPTVRANSVATADAFFKLRHARENAAGDQHVATTSGSLTDRVNKGILKYGSAPVIAGKN